jgi:signal transduction histidine kinase/ligand-binding sensor domain-containing protein
LLASTVHAQPYYFRHYEVENGLSNNTVFDCIQDKDGFMWFGTKDGLNRFDGYRFKVFNIHNPDKNNLSRDLISSFGKDKNGQLWVGSEKGLFLFDSRTESLLPFADSIKDIHQIHFDKKDRLWFLAGSTICRYNFETKTLKKFTADVYFNVTGLAETDDSTLWFSSSDGRLHRYNEQTERFTSFDMFAHSKPVVSKWIQQIFADTHNNIYIGTNSQGIKKFNTLTTEYEDILTYNDDGTTIYVRDIISANANEIWFATESGIFILDETTGRFTNLRKRFLDPYSLSDNAVYTLYKDNENGIWAGTYFGGVNYWPKQYFSFQKFFPDYTDKTISGSAVREICEDGFGNLWVGTEDAGITRINSLTKKITHYKPTGAPTSIANSNIHGLLVVGKNLWIGTFERGLDIMDIESGKVIRHFESGPGPNDLKSDFIVTLLRTRSGIIYLGTNNGLYRYNEKEENFSPVKEFAPGGFIASLLEDHEGTIWAGTHGNGIRYFNPSTGVSGFYKTEVNNKNSLSANIVNAIYEDVRNELWFATEGGGLCKLNPKTNTFTRYTTQDGLPSNFIFKVLEDASENLWVTTSKGLVNINRHKEQITVYTRANGLLNDQFNYNSGYKAADGTIYFGSVRGMITFNPSRRYQSNFVPPVFITGFQVNNKELEIDKDDKRMLSSTILYTDNITLSHDQSTFSIDFAALSYSSPERTEYSYKMEGVDKDWTRIETNRRVYYTNIKPGSYQFKLKASSRGFQGNYEKSLAIKILPPLWATPLAYAGYIAVGLLIAFYLLRSYHKIQENKKEKEIYEAKIDFFTNIAHEIKTPLTLIKGPVDNLGDMVEEVPAIRQDVAMMERNTKRLVNLVNQILDFRQTEAKGFSLDFSTVNMNELVRENFVSFEALAAKRKISYTLHLPATTVYLSADAEALTKILTNLFSNAVKYAESKVVVTLYTPSKDDPSLYLDIRNDGNIIPDDMKEKIFEPFVRLKETLRQKGTGIGLALARSLTELHGGNLFCKGSEEGMNVFVLRLPMNHAMVKEKEFNQQETLTE